MFKRFFLSDLLVRSSHTQRIVYIALLTAFSVVSNMFLEFKFFDVQFSITIVVSCLIGVLIGGLPGFLACMLGDFLGYLVNSWGQLYMPWIGISTGMFALISGVIVNGVRLDVKGGIYIKLAIISVITFFVCTVGINSTGFYFYNQAMGFSKAVIDFANEHFGGNTGFFMYICYRLFFKGQIFNSLFNYAALIAVTPFILKIKIFKKAAKNDTCQDENVPSEVESVEENTEKSAE